eukprot:m.30954 g.30954  ORF g.30954 m.30954 type:complete len:389 (+) comp9600_c0_seq1:55-1221(+)
MGFVVCCHATRVLLRSLCHTRATMDFDRRCGWFQALMGFEEHGWDFDEGSIPADARAKMGEFETVSITTLKQRLEQRQRGSSRGAGSTDDADEGHGDASAAVGGGAAVGGAGPPLIVRYRSHSGREDLFDTSALQFHGQPGAMYQVASNFNCLEVAGAYVDPFCGSFVTNQMVDCTQGPSAAGGAGPGAVLRAVRHHQQPIDLLCDTPLEHTNGKLRQGDVVDKSTLSDGSANPSSDKASVPMVDPDTIKVGLHTDVVAMYKRTRQEFATNPDGPRIDQVFTSTCICRAPVPNAMSALLLGAAYEGTYLCAAVRQSPELVLTLIGGGCFSNDPEQIAAAIAKAHSRWAPHLDPKCTVLLPVYDKGPARARDLIKSLAKHNITVVEDEN